MNFKKYSKNSLLGFICTYMLMTPVWADDTEIFFGGTTNIAVRPNVLFVLDTSSSMNSTDGVGQTRLDRMKDALRSILGSAQDINVGMMRFSNPGGSVIYPIKYIDEAVTTDVIVAGQVSSQISTGDDDAVENTSGVVTLNDSILSMMSVPAVALANSLSIQIAHDDDDAEERESNGSVDVGSSDLEIMHENGSTEQIIGVRFLNVAIPQGATIDSAYIEFEVDERRDTGSVKVDVWGEDTANADRYSSSDDDISDRTKTSAKVSWNFTSEPNKNSALNTSSLVSLVQEIVDRSDWSADNAMAFILEDDSSSGYRELESHDGESDAAAILHVDYSYSVPAVTNQSVGLRFDGVSIPQGADITSATLSFVAGASSSSATSLTIRAEDEDTSAEFSGAANDLSGRTLTTDNVAWNSISSWTVDESYSVSGLEDVIEEVVTRTGWCGGNALTLMLSGTGARYAKAFEENSSEGAVLTVEYDPDSVDDDSCTTEEYTIAVNSSNDDAEENSSGAMDLDSSDLELTEESTEQKIGLRFNDIQLLKDADVASAYIEFTTDETDPTETTNLTLKIEMSDDADAFSSSDDDISDRSTSGSPVVSWDITAQWDTVTEVHRTPNIASLIETAAARAGWVPGNSIAIIIEGTGKRVAESYDGTAAPRLVMNVQSSSLANAAAVAGDTVRYELIDVVNDIQYKSGTPIVDTLYEAALYYRGEEVDYGKVRGTGDRQEHTRVSHPKTYTGGTLNQPTGCADDNLSSTDCRDEEITGTATYTTPITETCQANYIVLLTDGSPSVNTAVDKVEDMMGYDDSTHCAGSGSSQCGHELVAFLKDNDQLDSLSSSQIIKTFTIGFNFSSDWLRDMAVEGGGSFYEADSATDLVQAFDSIIKSIKAQDATYVQPSVSVNQFNRFSHREDIYFSLFKPQETAKWIGNLKKYKLFGSPATVTGIDEIPAFDSSSGFFAADSHSFWSSDEDGNSTEKGGAANVLPNADSRNIYTYMGAFPVLTDSTGLLSTYPLTSANAAIDLSVLNIASQDATYRSDLISWARGLDIDGSTQRYEMGDPLHSKPVLVTYDSDAVADTYDSTIYIGTNEGFLHAFDAETGVELFSFIPEVLLGNLDTFYSNQNVANRPYGMDGGITSWTNDTNNDGDLLDLTDHVYIYAGMRRGGRNYYALDVSDRTDPRMLWQIEGGSGDFVELGQSWSAPKRLQVKFDGAIHDIIMFAGGYDTNQDNVSVRTADTQGRAIYMVDALTGALFWSAGPSSSYDLNLADMDYSIPSDITFADVDKDGYVDQFYVGDMGGQVWRFDITQSTALDDKADLVAGGVIADLAGDTAASNRRFYHAPDLALVSKTGSPYLALNLGSGYRAHPLNEAIEDRFYNLKQLDYVYTSPSTYTKWTEADLYDATDNLVQQGTEAEQIEAANALSSYHADRKDGWYIRLTNSGEKVLAKSLTINNQVLFTTYEPSPPDVTSCEPANGTARLYVVDIKDASATDDRDDDNDVDKEDRVISLKQGNIPSQPLVVDPEGSPPVVLVGTEVADGVDTGHSFVKTYWLEDED